MEELVKKALEAQIRGRGGAYEAFALKALKEMKVTEFLPLLAESLEPATLATVFTGALTDLALHEEGAEEKPLEIGDKVRGVDFSGLKDFFDDYEWLRRMEERVGHIGTIKELDREKNKARVRFMDGQIYYYPLDMLKKVE